jgi:hypothetical protein
MTDIPQRAFLVVQPEDMDRISQAMLAHITGGLK